MNEWNDPYAIGGKEYTWTPEVGMIVAIKDKWAILSRDTTGTGYYACDVHGELLLMTTINDDNYVQINATPILPAHKPGVSTWDMLNHIDRVADWHTVNHNKRLISMGEYRQDGMIGEMGTITCVAFDKRDGIELAMVLPTWRLERVELIDTAIQKATVLIDYIKRGEA